MPLCPQITNTAVTVTSTGMTTTSVTPVVTATSTDVAVVQASANGKNVITYSSASPSGSGTRVGDIWWQYSGATVIGQWAWSGSAWTSAPITNAVIANIDAAKITTGYIDVANRIQAGSIDAAKITANSITTSQLATGTLSATNITTGTLSSSVGLTATTGTIGGFTLASTYLSGSGGFTLYANGTIDGGSANTIFYGKGNFGGGTAGSETLIVTGASNFNGALTGLAITANGELYAAGHSTTANAANGYVFTTGGRIARSTASSARYKENIVDLLSVPELDPKKLLALPVRAFTYKAGQLPETDDRFEQMIPGFIAEEVDAIYPVAADYVNGPESWNDRMIVPALLSLVQDLSKRVAELEKK